MTKKKCGYEQVEENVVDDIDHQSITGDDCEVVGGEDYDIVEDDENDVGVSDREDLVKSGDLSDTESGIPWSDDEKIPDPLSSDSEEDEVQQMIEHETADDDPSEYLQLGKCYSTTDDFKIAVVKYSLKSSYDIMFYRSESRKIGAKCSDVNCPWRCYASYEKRKQKLQIKVFVNEHICVRSGYSKVLKQGAIAWLFTDRLAKDPKLTKTEMANEIKREYNLVVSEEQCGKAKTFLAKKRKQCHELHFATILDYQAETVANKSKLKRVGRVMTCSNCKQEGHNKVGCKNATATSVTTKRPRGRPRKLENQVKLCLDKGCRAFHKVDHKECQKEFHKVDHKECQNEFHKVDHKECQNEFHKVDHKECQNEFHKVNHK